LIRLDEYVDLLEVLLICYVSKYCSEPHPCRKYLIVRNEEVCSTANAKMCSWMEM
jgi:hypothetical protein